MPEPTPQVAAAEAAYESLRALAHMVRDTPSTQLYALNRELLGIARMFPDVLRKLSALALARSDDATFDTPVPGHTPKAEVEGVARQLLTASELIDAAESCLDHTSGWLSAMVWQPDRDAPEPDFSHEAPVSSGARERQVAQGATSAVNPSSQRSRAVRATGGLGR